MAILDTDSLILEDLRRGLKSKRLVNAVFLNSRIYQPLFVI